jgi:phosphoribosylformylglycinamidine cyclo-ligase
VKGIVDGCTESGCQLLGGETAEMPGFYADGEYDLAGFAVGSVLKTKVIDGSRIQAGDVILGFKSSGVHSNGFSLVRKVIEKSGSSFDQAVEWSDQSLGLTLLTPTRLYVKDVMDLIDMVDVKGLVHITGGGFPENIPRVIPKGLGTRIFKGSWEIPPLFNWIQENGGIADSEMFLTFNMGIGMIAVMSAADAEKALASGVDAKIIGEIVEGNGVDIQL